MTGLRILVTGSRSWTDRTVVIEALIKAGLSPLGTTWSGWSDITLIHGAACGLDSLAAEVGKSLGMQIEPYSAHNFVGPKVRNRHMVSLGADICVAFADRWASGTGHCARLARAAGIPTVDYGVSTRIEDRPRGDHLPMRRHAENDGMRRVHHPDAPVHLSASGPQVGLVPVMTERRLMSLDELIEAVQAALECCSIDLTVFEHGSDGQRTESSDFLHRLTKCLRAHGVLDEYTSRPEST